MFERLLSVSVAQLKKEEPKKMFSLKELFKIKFIAVTPWSLQGNMSCYLEVSEPVPWSSEVVQGSQ